jgi:hypothetical protein
MRFTPVSEEEANAQSSGVWPNGDYDFEIKDATEKESAAGNEMTELEVWLYDNDGKRKMVFDYLVATEKSAWKIRHFAASCGLLPQYERGSLSANEMVGRTGKCTIATQPAKDGYPAKNVIRVYLKAAGGSAARPVASRARTPAPAGDIDDEIPF